MLRNTNLSAILYTKKSNLHHTRGITPKRVTSGGAHLRGIASEQHYSEDTWQRWRVVGDTESNSTCAGIKPQTSRTDKLSNCQLS